MAADPLVDTLRAIVGEAHVLTDADLRATYETDWTRRFTGTARCVVRPANTAEVAAVLRACNDAGAAVVPQGGNTGLVGGGVPHSGEVVISLRRMNRVEALDAAGREVIVEAGVTAAALNEAAGVHGLTLGVDLASRQSATIGGMISTNAGGIHVLRHGMMRSQVMGLEFALTNGDVIDRLVAPSKDNTGYDLRHLMAGAEGTLGIVTRARLHLVPMMPARAVALAGFDSTDDAVALALAAKNQLADLEAAEFFVANGLELVRRHAKLTGPFAKDYAVYVLLEVAARVDPSAVFAEFLERETAGVDVAFATERADRERLWAYRERHTEAINAEGVPIKLDTAIPLPRLDEFLIEAPKVAHGACAGAQVVLFGHIADGSIHVNLLAESCDEEAVSDAVLRLVAKLGGSISAEHGIGVAKTPWLSLTRSAADIAAMRAIKSALDPGGIMNPSVLFGG